MTEFKKNWLPRILIGGAAGIALHLLLGYLLGCFTLFGPSRFTGFVFPFCGFPYHLEWLGVLLSFALWTLFGAEVGIATLPFADGGRELVVRSLLHYAVTAATVCLWAGLNVASHPTDYIYFLLPLTLVYLLVWLGRWAGWYMEVAAIRERLGLAPKTSPLKWQETLPYFGYALLLCLALPLVLWLLDDRSDPILSVMYGWLLLPVGGFMSGLSLGRRHGFCPLYPAACTLFILIFILPARFLTVHCDPALVPTALLAALSGNLAGAARRRAKLKKGEVPHEKTGPSV